MLLPERTQVPASHFPTPNAPPDVWAGMIPAKLLLPVFDPPSQNVPPAALIAPTDILLLIVTVPHWANWAQALATAQLPTAQTALAWLGRLIVEPSMIWDGVVVFLDQLTISSADEMDVLITLASLVLVVASVTALAQLLNDESSTVTAWRVSA